MAEPAHSKFSASAAARWLACPGSMVLSQGAPDSTSFYASEGTAAHRLLDGAISNGIEPQEMLGTAWEIDGHAITVDQDMIDAVNIALGNIREMTAGADILVGESRVNYAEWLGVDRAAAWGTSDVIAVIGNELMVADYKHGMGVEVDAEQNEQLMLYAGGALLEYQDLADIQTVRMVIHQPRIKKAPSEWAISVEELKAWLTGRARSGAVSVINAEAIRSPDQGGMTGTEWEQTFLRPTEKGCRWCKAKATCPALRDEVASTVDSTGFTPATPDEFATIDGATPAALQHAETAWLSAALSKVDLIEDWCKAVRAEVERRLLAGDNVPGYKLVAGKRGARQWTDEAQAEQLLKTFRLKQEEMYDFKLISPTSAEKLAKAGVIGPRQAPKLQALIVQKDGKPHVAPLSDKREALSVRPVADDFETQPADAGDLC